MRRFLKLWNEALKHEEEHPGLSRNADELEFLPAALEILETPVSPKKRLFIYVICAFVVLFGLWAWFGKMDIVVVTRGKIIPGGQVKLIQASSVAVVRNINVIDGQKVNKGEVLIDLDDTEITNKVEQLKNKINDLNVAILRNAAAISYLQTGITDFKYEDSYQHDLYIDNKMKLQSDVALLKHKLEEITKKKEAIQVEKERLTKELNKMVATIPILRKQEKIQHRSSNHSSLSSQALSANQATKDVVEMMQNKEIQEVRLRELDKKITLLSEQRYIFREEFRNTSQSDLNNLKQELKQLVLELKSLELKKDLLHIKSPVDGFVQQLKVHTVGGVVKAIDPLMIIVPENAELLSEAVVENKDIGFVRQGQDVKIKIDSFPFTKYGLLYGKVKWISADAINDEEQGLIYKVKYTLDEDTIKIGNKMKKIEPGMTVTGEIKIGKRRVLEYFVEPILRYKSESLNER